MQFYDCNPGLRDLRGCSHLLLLLGTMTVCGAAPRLFQSPCASARNVLALQRACVPVGWSMDAGVLILGWSGSHCTPHAIRIGQLWGAYSFLCFAILTCVASPSSPR